MKKKFGMIGGSPTAEKPTIKPNYKKKKRGK